MPTFSASSGSTRLRQGLPLDVIDRWLKKYRNKRPPGESRRDNPGGQQEFDQLLSCPLRQPADFNLHRRSSLADSCLLREFWQPRFYRVNFGPGSMIKCEMLWKGSVG